MDGPVSPGGTSLDGDQPTVVLTGVESLGYAGTCSRLASRLSGTPMTRCLCVLTAAS
jgi:hypothetical protein